MSLRSSQRPAPSLISRTYTAADRATLPAARVRAVQRIEAAPSLESADHHAAVALGDAAVWIEQGEVTEGLALIHQAHVAHQAHVRTLLDDVCVEAEPI